MLGDRISKSTVNQRVLKFSNLLPKNAHNINESYGQNRRVRKIGVAITAITPDREKIWPKSCLLSAVHLSLWSVRDRLSLHADPLNRTLLKDSEFSLATAMVTRSTGVWLVLALLLGDRCAGRELSLYRVDGNEGNVKRHRAASAAADKTASVVSDASYVKVAEVEPYRDATHYRSEEAKLRLERRRMFFRNLNLGSMSMSMSMSIPATPGNMYTDPSVSTPGDVTFADPTFAAPTDATWAVLNAALQAALAALSITQTGRQSTVTIGGVPLYTLIDNADAHGAAARRSGAEDVQPGNKEEVQMQGGLRPVRRKHTE